MSAPLRIGIADDEPLFAQGLAMILESQPDFQIAWQAVHGEDALGRMHADPVDILLMDVQMPVMDGIEATRRLVDEGSSCRIIILTTFDTDDVVLCGIDAGASGFLLKTTPPHALVDAIRTVRSGDSVISPGPTRRLLAAVRSPGRPALATTIATTAPCESALESDLMLEDLTERELEILSLIARGLTNQEICDELWVSMATVKTHVSHVLMKTGSRDRVQLVLFALRTGVLDPASLLSHNR